MEEEPPRGPEVRAGAGAQAGSRSAKSTRHLDPQVQVQPQQLRETLSQNTLGAGMQLGGGAPGSNLCPSPCGPSLAPWARPRAPLSLGFLVCAEEGTPGLQGSWEDAGVPAPRQLHGCLPRWPQGHGLPAVPPAPAAAHPDRVPWVSEPAGLARPLSWGTEPRGLAPAGRLSLWAAPDTLSSPRRRTKVSQSKGRRGAEAAETEAAEKEALLQQEGSPRGLLRAICRVFRSAFLLGTLSLVISDVFRFSVPKLLR